MLIRVGWSVFVFWIMMTLVSSLAINVAEKVIDGNNSDWQEWLWNEKNCGWQLL